MSEYVEQLRVKLEQVAKDLEELHAAQDRLRKKFREQEQELRAQEPGWRSNEEQALHDRQYHLGLKVAIAEVVEELVLPELRRSP